jgi:D-arabinose 1-dehydrogenase-like Zn-dependent alcohol dehydrogenase
MAPHIPKKQWAQVIEKVGGPVEYKEIDVATPGPDEVLVNVKYSGVCHTDLHAVNGDWRKQFCCPFSYPELTRLISHPYKATVGWWT